MDLKALEKATPQQLAQNPEELAKIDDITLNALGHTLSENIWLARGIVKEKIDSANFEKPILDAGISLFPDEEAIISSLVSLENNCQATFFVFKVIPKTPETLPEELDVDKNSEIVIVFTEKASCTGDECQIPAVDNLKRAMKDKTIINCGTGILKRGYTGGFEIKWGNAINSSQEANSKDPNYAGPYPSKFASWVKTQIEKGFETPQMTENFTLCHVKKIFTVDNRLLDPDLAYEWIVVEVQIADGRLGEIEPMRHYKDLAEEHSKETGSELSRKVAELTMRLSDPAAIQAFNEYVDEFNAHIEDIKAGNEPWTRTGALWFIKQVKTLVNMKKSEMLNQNFPLQR